MSFREPYCHSADRESASQESPTPDFYMYMYMNICVYMCIYIYTHMNTHIHPPCGPRNSTPQNE